MLCAKTSGRGVDHGVDRDRVAWKSPSSVSIEDVGAELFADAVTVRATCAAPPSSEIVAIDHGHHDVLEAERPIARATCSGSRCRRRRRAAGRDRAEAAAARADVAEEHHGGGAFAPALADVRAARLFADGEEVELAERLLELVVAIAAGRAP